MLLQQLARADLPAPVRKAAAGALAEIIDRHRKAWSTTAHDLEEELQALQRANHDIKLMVAVQSSKWTRQQVDEGDRTAAWRLRHELEDREGEYAAYTAYLSHLNKLLALQPDPLRPYKGEIKDVLPEMSLGEIKHPGATAALRRRSCLHRPSAHLRWTPG